MFRLDKNILIGAIIFLALLFSCIIYGKQANINSYKKAVSQLQFENLKFQEEVDENGLKIISQEQIILSQKDAIEHNLLDIEGLKRVSSQVKVVTNTVIDTILITNVDTVIQYIEGDAYLKLPKKYDISSDFIEINAIVDVNGLQLNALKLKNKTTVSVGFKGQGLFKPDLAIVELKHSNPYVVTTEVTNVVIEKDKKLLNDKKVWLGFGLILGLIIK
jgi:hypothetical protein